MQVFDEQRHRGTQGFGLFDGQEMNMVHASKEDKILKWLVRYPTNLLMFHHRQPTSTVNVKRAAHPFSTKDYFGNKQYILVHNGHINNSRTLYNEHWEMEIDYQSELQDGTFNDSESLLWDFALTIEGHQDKMKATGRIAFVCMQIIDGKLERLYFGRNLNPLNMFRDKNGIALSSEGPGEPIEPDTLYHFHYGSKRLFHKPFELPTGYTSTRYDRPLLTAPTYTDSNYLGDYDGYPTYGNNWGNYQPSTTPSKASYDYDTKTQTYLLTDDDDELETYNAPQSEVDKRVAEYLTGAKGHYEMAYWTAEDDYEELQDYNDGHAEIAKELRLLEQVMFAIQYDPEYKDNKSVNHAWRTLVCQN